MKREERRDFLKKIKIYKEFYEVPKFSSWFRIKSDNIACTADIHSPFHSWLWVDRFLTTSSSQKTTKCIINGDLFQLESCNLHKDKYGDIKFDHELGCTGYLLEQFMKVFDEIYLTQGNHDKWVTYFTNGLITFEDLFNLMFGKKDAKMFKLFKQKIHISKYPYAVLNDSWRITHPKNYSQVKLAVANRLADKYQMNIINAHGHYFSFGYSRSGKHYIIDTGGLFDGDKMEYIMTSDTTHPVWNNGFVIIKNNKPQLYSEHTEWV